MMKHTTFSRQEIPFIPDDGDGAQCGQACLRMTIQWLGTKDIDWKEANRLCLRQAHEMTWPTQITYALEQLNISYRYYTMTSKEPLTGTREEWKKAFGAEIIDALSEDNEQRIRKTVQESCIQEQEVEIIQLKQLIEQNTCCIVLLNWNRIKKKKGYQGHFVVVTGYDANGFIVHNSGPNKPEAHQHIEQKTFEQAWNTLSTRELILVSKNT